MSLPPQATILLFVYTNLGVYASCSTALLPLLLHLPVSLLLLLPHINIGVFSTSVPYFLLSLLSLLPDSSTISHGM